MIDARDEARVLRARDADPTALTTSRDRYHAPGSPCLLAQTGKIKTYPTTAQCFFSCTPLTVLGAEVEGGAGSTSPEPGSFFALNLGNAIPPLGAWIIATYVDNRWVFRYDG